MNNSFYPTKDLAGQAFGNYLVLSFSHRDTNLKVYWLTRCLNCGREAPKGADLFTQGKKRGLGCRNCQQKPKGQTGLNRLYKAYQHTAKKKNLLFDLTKEDFKTLTSDVCYYCGAPPARTMKQPNAKQSVWGEYRYNGIDRKDNSLGYVATNCITSCAFCNWAKGSRPHLEFEEYMIGVQKRVLDGHLSPLLNDHLGELSLSA